MKYLMHVFRPLDIFIYVKACFKPMAYSGKFRTVDIFSQFHVHYSGIAHKQIMHNLNLT